MSQAIPEPLDIVGGDVYTPTGVIPGGFVAVAERRIVHVGTYRDFRLHPRTGRRLLEAPGKIVAPGFIDLHVHGGGGYDVSQGTDEALAAVSAMHARHGTTCMLPTLVSSSLPVMLECAAAVARAGGTAPGAAMLGLHLEGPWLNPAYKGAQNPAAIRRPDLAEFQAVFRAARGAIRLVTLAPEIEGADEAIAGLRALGVLVAAGHTGASFARMAEAARIGVAHCTHAYNGMLGFHHREPGVVGALLALDELTCDVIADGFHVHPAALSILHKCKGRAGMALVTDAVMAAGMPDGRYELGGLPVQAAGGTVRLADGSLAGSVLTMDRAVQNAARMLGITLHEAIVMASLVPARLLGIDDRKGALAPGKDADLLLLDAAGNVETTIIGGTIVHERGGG